MPIAQNMATVQSFHNAMFGEYSIEIDCDISELCYMGNLFY